ncbi:MAG: isoprenylcysteine carboxylmethyltransferase family protein [Tannerellaceae bacterium]|jgi:protein-S-isoprenylcysteine O-methyltransferase Ste14|nr:isoprenylcysteine carboxylmethyltransferase family protein [Tannerellaceae bacterium]
MEKISKNGIKAIIKNLFAYLVAVAVFLLCSGEIFALRGFTCYGLMIVGAIINNLFLIRNNPEVLNFRADDGSNTKIWDKKLIGLYFLMSIIVIPAVSGFDIRFEWSNLNIYFIIPGILLYLMSLGISTFAMVTNKYFEGTVRIQTERKQTVIDKGPYSVIRHPGNLCMIVSAFIPPLIIGSVYAFIPSLFAAFFIILRTINEDNLLQKELNGYNDYAQRVKYKLIPRIW